MTDLNTQILTPDEQNQRHLAQAELSELRGSQDDPALLALSEQLFIRPLRDPHPVSLSGLNAVLRASWLLRPERQTAELLDWGLRDWDAQGLAPLLPTLCALYALASREAWSDAITLIRTRRAQPEWNLQMLVHGFTLRQAEPSGRLGAAALALLATATQEPWRLRGALPSDWPSWTPEGGGAWHLNPEHLPGWRELWREPLRAPLPEERGVITGLERARWLRPERPLIQSSLGLARQHSQVQSAEDADLSLSLIGGLVISELLSRSAPDSEPFGLDPRCGPESLNTAINLILRALQTDPQGELHAGLILNAQRGADTSRQLREFTLKMGLSGLKPYTPSFSLALMLATAQAGLARLQPEADTAAHWHRTLEETRLNWLRLDLTDQDRALLSQPEQMRALIGANAR